MRAYVVVGLIGGIVLGACGGDDSHRTGWYATGYDDRTVQLAVLYGGCERPQDVSVSVEETDEVIRIKASVRNNDEANCNSVGRETQREVVLDAPIGDRTVVGCNRPAPSEPCDIPATGS